MQTQIVSILPAHCLAPRPPAHVKPKTAFASDTSLSTLTHTCVCQSLDFDDVFPQPGHPCKLHQKRSHRCASSATKYRRVLVRSRRHKTTIRWSHCHGYVPGSARPIAERSNDPRQLLLVSAIDCHTQPLGNTIPRGSKGARCDTRELIERGMHRITIPR